MPMKRTAACVAVLAAILGLAGSLEARSAKKDLAITLYEKRIQDMSADGLTLSLVYKIANAAPSPWFLNGYDYKVVMENSEYFRLDQDLDTAIELPPAKATLIALPIKITYAHLFRAVPAAANKDKLACYIIGGMSFAEDAKEAGDRLALAGSAEFPVYRDVEVVCHPLEARDLTIGGADITFKVTLRNPNPFPLDISRLAYALELGGHRVAEGLLGGDKTIAGRGQREFQISLLLDFFELGNAIYTRLQNPPVACRFQGEVQMRTIWGEFTLPFDANEPIGLNILR